jgi:hypothetical protein
MEEMMRTVVLYSLASHKYGTYLHARVFGKFDELFECYLLADRQSVVPSQMQISSRFFVDMAPDKEPKVQKLPSMIPR